MQPPPLPQPTPAIASLLAELEAISRSRADRVLRLRGTLPSGGAEDGTVQDGAAEPFELLIFRGFSSSTTHATAADPDRPALPEGARIEGAELLAGPLNPLEERLLAGPGPVAAYLDPGAWEQGPPPPQS